MSRTLIVPVDLGTVHDTWSVVGMRGTGSKDFVVDDVFVPVERTFSLDDEPYDAAPLYNRRSVMVTIWTLNAANSLGMARGAINAFVELASSLGSTSASTLLRDRPAVQATLGEAEAIISGARAYLLDSVGTAWNAICDGISDPGREIAQARLAITHAVQESVRAVDLLCHMPPGQGLAQHSRWRDQHDPPQAFYRAVLSRPTRRRAARRWFALKRGICGEGVFGTPSQRTRLVGAPPLPL